MSIFNGHELLDKLENIDPALVAGADREPERTPRWTWNIGAWVAVAACLCVLCLPLILKCAFVPAATTEGAAAGGADFGTSLAIEGGLGEYEGADGGDAWPGQGAEEEMEGAVLSELQQCRQELLKKLEKAENAGEVLIEEADEDDPNSWRRVYIPKNYISSLPEGLPAEDYFSYNSQEAEPLWSDFTWEGEEDISGWSKFMYLPEMSALGYGPFPDIGISYDQYDEVEYVRVRWEGSDSDKRVAVWFARKPVGGDASAPEDLVAYKQKYGETIIQRGNFEQQNDIEISVLGGLHTDKTLTFWKGNRWYRIHGNETTDPEDLVTVLNWLLSSVDLGQLAARSDAALLQDQPDAFAGYYPTDRRFVPLANRAVMIKDGDELLTMQMDYDYGETPLITHWLITGRFLNPADEWPDGLGDLYSITQEQVIQAIETSKADYRESHGLEYSTDHMASLTLYFRWDGYYIMCDYKLTQNAEEDLWDFFQYLQSDEVKIERKIGDVVILQPYTAD